MRMSEKTKTLAGTLALWVAACALSGLVVYWTSASPTVSDTIAAVAAGAVPGPEPSLMHGAASAATPASTSQQLEDGNNISITAGDGTHVTDAQAWEDLMEIR